jgi:hypothetical protein
MLFGNVRLTSCLTSSARGVSPPPRPKLGVKFPSPGVMLPALHEKYHHHFARHHNCCSTLCLLYLTEPQRATKQCGECRRLPGVSLPSPADVKPPSPAVGASAAS